jgi:phosphopentomutase
MPKRVFLIVLDSFGMGESPDAGRFGDEGSNTLASVAGSSRFHAPHLTALGLFNIDGAVGGKPSPDPVASFARLGERSPANDTTVGHWEIAGVAVDAPLPLYPQGFPADVMARLTALTGKEYLCNLPYSGTQVLDDYGEEHVRTGKPILYTSGDSVMQIAAHEDVIPLEDLYEICRKARAMMQPPHGVGRIIARPFVGAAGKFTRTRNRHDFSFPPPRPTMLDALTAAKIDVISVGKIYDIFAGQGIARSLTTTSNEDGMEKTIALAGEDFTGLCFVNLVDFDMLYGHRNDVDGYADAITRFDVQLGAFRKLLRPDDVVILTADHGCDPSTPSTDHSREYVPMLIFGEGIKSGVNLGTRDAFADIAATVLAYLGAEMKTEGTSFCNNVAM